VVGPLELFAWSKVFALGRDALEVIRVVLVAVRGVRYDQYHHELCVPMFGLVRLGKPGYDGRVEALAREDSGKSLPSKLAV